MPACVSALRRALVLVVLAGPLASIADAAVGGVRWAPKRFPIGCETPRVFYSNQHVDGRLPCCPTIEGVCAGGGACPGSGVCSDGKACRPGPVTPRPNIIMFVADDQGECAYGHANECRSTLTGTPIPAPRTPSLDVLAGHGTVFPIVHNTSSWCFPSLATVLTGRYQRSMNGANKLLHTTFATMPSALRGLMTEASAEADPYNAGNAIGGYCTMLGGKFTGALDQNAFDAITRTTRKLGRSACVNGGGGSPECGASIPSVYDPTALDADNRLADVFHFLRDIVHARPGTNPIAYEMQHFFMWLAPRLPHQPLRAPLPVRQYLFGNLAEYPLGGVMDFGQWCVGSSCPPTVSAFTQEGVFGRMPEYYANVWWTDDNVRELRRYLVAASTPHCIDAAGVSHFDVAGPGQCDGTWTAIAPDLPRNTIFMYFSDNGWQLPNSKHGFSENGYRTRLIIFDPRTLPSVPHWDPAQQAAPAPQIVEALAHTSDMLPTALGFALGTSGSQVCPAGPAAQGCDGKDLGEHLMTAPGGPAASETLRHSLCGHQTSRVTSPGRNRYLLTRPGSLGRCTKTSNPSCTTSAQCGPGNFCVGGRCAAAVGEQACSATAPCPAGAACLGAKCRMAPTCFQDSDCTALVGPGYACEAQEQRWCRNAPNAECSTDNDCPVCPSSNGQPLPCSRKCEARAMKLYVSSGTQYFLTDLFIDPDEANLYAGDPKDPSLLITSLSDVNGPYGEHIRRMNCCIDDWWPDMAQLAGTLCTVAHSCPADLTCNE
jgi:hypothetical protein